jgi:hypothetical protein
MRIISTANANATPPLGTAIDSIVRVASAFTRRRVAAATLLSTLLLVPCITHASHGNGAAPVAYNGSLDPSAAQTATLTGGYDWYCFAGTPGARASVTVTRTAGTLLPNLELWSGVVANGTPAPYAGLIEDPAGETANSSASSITVAVTLPASASGKYSVVVSTWLGETGSYSIALTGGTATTCSAATPVVAGPATGVPALTDGAMLALLTALIAGLAVGGQRRALRAR